MTQTTTPCDVPDCIDEAAIQHQGERRCYRHALEAGNAWRAERGLPPVTIDDEGAQHVQH